MSALETMNGLAGAAVKIELLHVRDPDSDCDIRLWIDGKQVAVECVDIDPGRGYSREDWDENIAWAEKLPPGSFRDAVLEAYRANAGSEYVR